jgi:hypothetical protein
MIKINSKSLLTTSFVGALLSIAGSASAQDCPTCCHVFRSQYACAIPEPVCSMNDRNLEQDTCTNFIGLTFSEQPGKILRIDWDSERQRSGPAPTNAFMFGLDDNDNFVCSLEAGGFQLGFENDVQVSTEPGECNAATHFVYDANSD